MFIDSITLSYLLVFFNFINLFFKILIYYQPSSVADFRLKGKSGKTFYIVVQGN
jgi:hypothetical protein